MTYEELKKWLDKVVYIDNESEGYRVKDFAIAAIAVVGLLLTIGIAGFADKSF